MKSKYRLVLIAMLATMLCACSRSLEYYHAEGAAWGTTFHVTYLSDKDLSDSIVDVMQAIDNSLSPFNDKSLIARINAGDDIAVDTMWRKVFYLSQEVCRYSDGAFDPTVAPLINLWGFGYREGAEDVPDDAAIDSALCRVGILECNIGTDGKVMKKHPLTEFNFSAVAKGFGVDMIASMLRRNGCADYMVEVGGEIALSGDGPSGDGWNIQIDAPDTSDGAPIHNKLKVIHLTDMCIATSGNYRNFRDTSRGRVAHTINPVTGRPKDTDILSATVLAPDCATADALATAMMAQPSSAAMKMIANIPDVEAMIVTLAPDSTYHISKTKAFDHPNP